MPESIWGQMSASQLGTREEAGEDMRFHPREMVAEARGVSDVARECEERVVTWPVGRGSERSIETVGGLAIRRGPAERPRQWGPRRDALSGLQFVPPGPPSAAVI